ncbi:hypothetical protein SBV1_460052 [Verrucomicrobia bacterium]|nr:hypothetical protein SBV1_460052 [Verrucomicrobiota bacterium]
MKTSGQRFLDELGGPFPNGFETRFSRISTRLGLGAALDGHDLNLLWEAAFCATLCNIAFNGLGGCGGEIKPEREANRITLEGDFMGARNRFYDSAGWKSLSASPKRSIQGIFLSVLVREDQLAV